MDETLSPDDVRELTRARLESGAWWCVPLISEHAMAFIVACQRRYYPAGPDGGVDYWPLPEAYDQLGVVGVGLLRRRELPLPELARFLSPQDDPGAWAPRARLEAELAADPILFVPEDDTEASVNEARTRADAFLSWLGWPTAATGEPASTAEE